MLCKDIPSLIMYQMISFYLQILIREIFDPKKEPNFQEKDQEFKKVNFIPSYATFNLDIDPSSEKSIFINNEDLCQKCLEGKKQCTQIHSWLLTASMIKTVT